MKKFIYGLLFISLILFNTSCDDDSNSIKPVADEMPDSGYLPELSENQHWNLVWNDEFEGEQLDSTKWEHTSWVQPGEDQPRKGGYWREDAAILDSTGYLKMLTYYDNEKKRYIDGCIRTRGKYHKRYGYFEIRVKFQEEIGHWSAFWLMSDSVHHVGNNGEDGTEIDIFEKISPTSSDVFHTLHWDGYGASHGSDHKLVRYPGLDDGFHNIGLWWTPEQYKFYINGSLTWTSTAGGVCKSPLHIQISDEVGTWAGNINFASLPDQWLVDYVRVYDIVGE